MTNDTTLNGADANEPVTSQDPLTPNAAAAGLLTSDPILWPLFVTYADSLRDFGRRVKHLVESEPVINACLVRSRSDIAAATVLGYVPVYPEFLDHLRVLRETLDERGDSPEISKLRSKVMEDERRWDELLMRLQGEKRPNGGSSAFNPISIDGLFSLAHEMGEIPYLVQGVLPRLSIGVAIGAPNIGKSPYLHQLGLCIAAGIPFLGKPTAQGRVLYVDQENQPGVQAKYVRSLLEFLGIEKPPGFLPLNLNDPKRAGFKLDDLWKAIEDFRPTLVIVDPLKYFYPNWGQRSQPTIEVNKELRERSNQYGCMFVVVHHVRKLARSQKTGEFFKVSLEDDNTYRDWFQESAGAMEIINGTDWRFGLVEPSFQQKTRGAELATRGFCRGLDDDVPLEYLVRVRNSNDQPIGYKIAPAKLGGEDQRDYEKIPAGCITTKEIKRATGKTPNPANQFIKRVCRAGLMTRVSEGLYNNHGLLNATVADSPASSGTLAVN